MAKRKRKKNDRVEPHPERVAPEVQGDVALMAQRRDSLGIEDHRGLRSVAAPQLTSTQMAELLRRAEQQRAEQRRIEQERLDKRRLLAVVGAVVVIVLVGIGIWLLWLR